MGHHWALRAALGGAECPGSRGVRGGWVMAPKWEQERLRWVWAAPGPANCNQPELEATGTKPGPCWLDPCSVSLHPRFPPSCSRKPPRWRRGCRITAPSARLFICSPPRATSSTAAPSPTSPSRRRWVPPEPLPIPRYPFEGWPKSPAGAMVPHKKGPREDFRDRGRVGPPATGRIFWEVEKT